MTEGLNAGLIAPPAALETSGGANQIGVRAYNERLVMSLVRLRRQPVEGGNCPA